MLRTAATARLSPEQVDHYHRDGYLIYDSPVLPPDHFDALKSYFEGILSELPPAERPEVM